MSVLDLATALLRPPEAKLSLVAITVVATLAALLPRRGEGRRRLGTFLLIWGAGMATVMTLTSRLSYKPFGFHPELVAQCLTTMRSATHPESVLNLLLLAPLAVGVVLLCGRLWPALLVTAGSSVSIELIQNLTQLGGCEVDDVTRNIVGGFTAATCTWLMVRQRRSASANEAPVTPKLPTQRPHLAIGPDSRSRER